MCIFFFQAEDGIRDVAVTGVQTCALPIWMEGLSLSARRLRARFLESWEPLQDAPPFPSEDEHREAVRISELRQQGDQRSEEHTSELQSRLHLVCRLLLEKKKQKLQHTTRI